MGCTIIKLPLYCAQVQRLTERSVAAGAVAEVPRGLATKAKEIGMDIDRPAADPPADPTAEPAQGAAPAEVGARGAEEAARADAGEAGSEDEGKDAAEGDKGDGPAEGAACRARDPMAALASCFCSAALMSSKKALQARTGQHVTMEA